MCVLFRFLHLSKNHLTSLPQTLTRCNLNTIDLSDNVVDPLTFGPATERPALRPPVLAGLWELAGRAVSAAK